MRYVGLATRFTILALAVGCAAVAPPLGDYLPVRLMDGRVGILSNEGRTFLDVRLLDEVGRPVQYLDIFSEGQWQTMDVASGFTLAPAIDPISPHDVNRFRVPTLLILRLPPGRYQVKFIPYWWRYILFRGKVRVDHPIGRTGFTVGQGPPEAYDFRTARHWGWVLRIHGGDPPRRGPGAVNVNIRY